LRLIIKTIVSRLESFDLPQISAPFKGIPNRLKLSIAKERERGKEEVGFTF
jgi:hypothetical protein